MFIQWLLAALSIPAVLFLLALADDNQDFIAIAILIIITLTYGGGEFLVRVFDFIIEKTDNAFSIKTSRFIAFLLFIFFIYLLYAIFYLLFF